MSERRRRRKREEEARMQEMLELERRRRAARRRKRQREVMRRKMILAGIGILLVLAAVITSAVVIHKKNVEKKEQQALEQKKKEEEAAKKEEEENTLRMVAVGDNLIHEAIIQAGKDKDWDFNFLYENIQADIKDADLASVNQETPFVKNHDDAAGYPDFATPTEVGDALADAGFDIVTQATEHAFDQDADGVARSVSFWQTNYPEIALLGIHSQDGEKRYQVIEKKNFKVAVMNYSCLLSENHTIEDENSYMVDTYSENTVKTDLKRAKEEADVTIVYLHGGKSDSVDPDAKLEKRVEYLAEQGADIVICSHPHILKGYQKIQRPDGKEMLVYYSLGNFVSNQSSLENLLGGMAQFTLKRDAESGEISIAEYSMVPLVMHYNADYSEAGSYKLSDYTEKLASEHGIHETDSGEDFTLSALESAAEEAGEIAGGKLIESEEEDGTAQEDSTVKDSSEEDSTDEETTEE